ncbi:MAG TPA: BLUF domain-containing protein [Sphingomicrobium sp.]|nr:BLUF domain-containing protein [Sphingomicrobium sp.]
MELKALTYTSWARAGIRSDEVDSILSSARVNNPLEGLTGVLIFNGESFMQILEGGESAVDGLVARLRSDPRHCNMTIRDERLIGSRTFPDWSMAYLRLDNGEFEGEQDVERALRRDLTPSLRNILLGLTHSMTQAERPV